MIAPTGQRNSDGDRDSPWEISVVIALRDSQWFYRGSNPQFPDRYIALDGKLEQRAGDAFFAVGERFFIFEAKAMAANIDEEWMRGRTANDELRPPKSALVRLAGAMLENANEASLHLRNSVRGHFFAYWSSQCQLGADAASSIVVEPYLYGVERRGFFQSQHVGASGETLRRSVLSLKKRFELGWSWTNIESPCVAQIEAISAVPLAVLQTGQAVFIERNEGFDASWNVLGLTDQELKDYVDFLCANSSDDEPVRIVVMSASGRYFFYGERRSQLLNLFEPSRAMNRVPTKGSRVEIIAPSLDVQKSGLSLGRRFGP